MTVQQISQKLCLPTSETLIPNYLAKSKTGALPSANSGKLILAQVAQGHAKKWHSLSSAYAAQGEFRLADDLQQEGHALERVAEDLWEQIM